MRPSRLTLAASALTASTALGALTLATAGSAGAIPASQDTGSHRAAAHASRSVTRVKHSAHDTTRAAHALGALQPADCGVPSLVSSTGGSVSVGVSAEHSLTYGVSVDDDCLGADAGNVVIYLYQDNGAYYSVDAEYTGNDRAGNQMWQGTFTFDPSLTDDAAYWLDSNDYAGTWYAGVKVPGTTKLYDFPATSAYVKRYSTLTVDASEPTKKGATETVTGKLARANWEDALYHGYATQPVALQFRTTTGTYATLKTVNTSSVGTLSTTTTATVDGCYRWSFAGTTTTPPATVAGDCVDVT